MFNQDVRYKVHSWRVFNGAQQSHRSFLYFRNVIFVRSLPEMFIFLPNVVEIACPWLRRTYSSCSPGSPTDVLLPGWRLSRPDHVPTAVGWPSAMYPTAVCHHSGVVLSVVYVIFIEVAAGFLPLFLPLRNTGFWGLAQESLFLVLS